LREIKLSNSNLTAKVDDEDYDKLFGFNWILITRGYQLHVGYRSGADTVFMHNVLLPGLNGT
jgi:hypothetical protein